MKYVLILFCLLLSACFGDTVYVAKLKDSKQYIRVKKEGTKVTLLVADNKEMNNGFFMVEEDCIGMDDKNWTCIKIINNKPYETKMTNGIIYISSGNAEDTEKYTPIGFFD